MNHKMRVSIVRQSLIFFILVFPFVILKEYKWIFGKHRLIKSSSLVHHTPYHPDYLPMIVIVLTQNDEKTIEENLYSITKQNRQPHQIIYLDQGSTDQTKARLDQLMTSTPIPIQWIDLEQENITQTYLTLLHSFSSRDLVIQMGGETTFAHDHVLNIIEQAYQDPNVWLAYGQCLEVEKSDRLKHDQNACAFSWSEAHLKTFRVSHIHQLQVQPKDFIKKASLKRSTLYATLAHHAQEHLQFIPHPLSRHYPKVSWTQGRQAKYLQ